MGNSNWNLWSIIGALVVLLSLSYLCEARIDRSKVSELRCYTCDQETCKSFNKQQLKNCSTDDLMADNMGPTQLWNLTQIPFSKIHNPTPEFICQKIEAYSIREGKIELRRCALSLGKNQTCEKFSENLGKYGKEFYSNATCALCDYDACNNSGFNNAWIPVLFFSIMSVLQNDKITKCHN